MEDTLDSNFLESYEVGDEYIFLKFNVSIMELVIELPLIVLFTSFIVLFKSLIISPTSAYSLLRIFL